MSPEDVAERLRVWAASGGTWTRSCGRGDSRRRVKLECGHVRAVCGVALEYERGLMLREWLGEPECGDARERLARLQARASWTVETSRGIACEAIGLDKTDTPV
jgi:hypothetical protein